MQKVNTVDTNTLSQKMVYLERETKTLFLSGEWQITNANVLQTQLQNLNAQSIKKVDASKIEYIDTIGMLVIREFLQKIKIDKPDIESIIFKKLREFVAIFDTPVIPESTPIEKKPESPFRSLIDGFVLFVGFFGEITLNIFKEFLNPLLWRAKEVGKQVEQTGAKAVGIVGLSAFLVGLVIAYQVGVQIEKIGANIFIVDMISISSMRELVPLITAIIVAGRSGSSYTAQIGVMKITEELDAMRVLGFEPFRFIVLPRIIGLIFAMPLLVFFADMIAMVGGAFVANLQLGISYHAFAQRLYEAFALKHFYIGMVKAPFFALIIATIGCYRGFQVTGDSQSIGIFTTRSVVDSIFAVIFCDAIFSIILTRMDI
ncbi:MAG: ABC transporter permease [Sulfurovaceae bacterium]|nr:ABC transporter permease [Sulfurovaceae bacterium]MDD5548300.1 ABC transporter permease [Sulfurovaceae bacterium]